MGVRTHAQAVRPLPEPAPGLFLVTAAAPAHAADNGSWSVYPAASQIAARPYFYLSADPGQTIDDKVVVANKTGRPLTFRLYAADAYNTARDGGFAVRTVEEKQRGVGVWAKPAKSRVTVPAHGKVTVPFTLSVPEGAEPGDHPGALVALDERIDKGDGCGGARCAAGRRRAGLSAGGRTDRRRDRRRGRPRQPSPAARPGVGGQQCDDLVHPAQHRQRHPEPEGGAAGDGAVRPYAARPRTRQDPRGAAARASGSGSASRGGARPNSTGATSS